MGRWSRKIFGLSMDEVRFDVRGFRGGHEPGVREHIETVGESFLAGFHGALELDELPALEERLEDIDLSYRGFAYEGAAMSLFILDRLMPWRRQFDVFLAGRADAHIYMATVGAGWALARLPFGFKPGMRRLDPLLRWLALDGYGFHQGFFHWPESVEGTQAIPRPVRSYGPIVDGKSYGRRAFDQGLGRSLWFVEGADVERVPKTIASFAADRQADLWAGIGLAATYAGGVPKAHLSDLLQSAKRMGFDAELAQGCSFAAEARRRAGNPIPNTSAACHVFCGLDVEAAADISDETRVDLPADGELPAFEVWRRRIQERLQLTAQEASLTNAQRLEATG